MHGARQEADAPHGLCGKEEGLQQRLEQDLILALVSSSKSAWKARLRKLSRFGPGLEGLRRWVDSARAVQTVRRGVRPAGRARMVAGRVVGGIWTATAVRAI